MENECNCVKIQKISAWMREYKKNNLRECVNGHPLGALIWITKTNRYFCDRYYCPYCTHNHIQRPIVLRRHDECTDVQIPLTCLFRIYNKFISENNCGSGNAGNQEFFSGKSGNQVNSRKIFREFRELDPPYPPPRWWARSGSTIDYFCHPIFQVMPGAGSHFIFYILH